MNEARVSKPSSTLARSRSWHLAVRPAAIDALRAILDALPVTFPCPSWGAAHRPRRQGRVAQVFPLCKLAVREPKTKWIRRSGVVYVAPPDYHCWWTPHGALVLSSIPPCVCRARRSTCCSKRSPSDYGSRALASCFLERIRTAAGSSGAPACRGSTGAEPRDGFGQALAARRAGRGARRPADGRSNGWRRWLREHATQ